VFSWQPFAKQTFAFAYRSSYDRACASLFRSGSGAVISFKKRPLPPSVVAASFRKLGVPPPIRPVASVAAVSDIPANVDPGVLPATGSNDRQVTAAGVRIVGPPYELSGLSSIGGEPPKLAKPDIPDLPAVAADGPPVRASIVPNLFDFFGKRLSAPPPEPDAEPVD